MPNPPLPTPQVQALADEVHDAPVTWEGHTFTFMFTGREPIRQHVRAEAVKALAHEVLAHRARRWVVFHCPQYYPAGGWQDFVRAFATREDAEAFVAAQPAFDQGAMEVIDMADPATWEPSADFTPKEPK